MVDNHSLTKPDDLIDRSREWSDIDAMFGSDRPELMFCLGRRRVGKSFLLSRFCRQAGGLYYQATRRTEAEQLATLSRAVGQRFADPALLQGVAFPDWERLLAYVVARAAGEPFLLVLDEFPYLVDSAPALPSILQAWLDHDAPATRIKLVLSGSHVSAMRQLEGADQPLYGRRTRRLVLGSFAAAEVGAFVPAYSAHERLITFAALGGLPGHLSLLDPTRGLSDNLAALLLDPGGRLVDEAQHMLDSFLADAVVHYSVIEAIAGGDHTWKGITNRTGRTGGSLQRAVDWLVDMEVIERVVPITEKSPQRSKRALYRITDPYVAFWHRFVSPLVSTGSIGLVEPRHLWDSVVAPRLDDHMGVVVEGVCRDAIRAGRLPLPFTPVRVGEWWDASSQEQVDVVALGGDGELFVAECKWGEVSGKDLTTLERRASLVTSEMGGAVRRTYLAVFSARGAFDSAVVGARQAGRVMTFTGEDVAALAT